MARQRWWAAALVLGVGVGCGAGNGARVNTSVDVGADDRPGDKDRSGGGSFAGQPGDTPPPPAAPAPKGPRQVQADGPHAYERPLATLPGFHMLAEGGSRVFVEISGDVPVQEEEAKGVLTYRLRGVKVPARVNRMSLPTSHFSTPVSRVRLLQVDDDAALVIELRHPTKATSHIKKTAFGTVLSIDFPRHVLGAQVLGQHVRTRPSSLSAAEPRAERPRPGRTTPASAGTYPSSGPLSGGQATPPPPSGNGGGSDAAPDDGDNSGSGNAQGGAAQGDGGGG